jgi:glycosyltransferase involved in cell wall biosynthesis
MSLQQATIIVPCFNEEENLRNLVFDFQQEKYYEIFNLLVVENGSTDGSLDYLKQLSIPNFNYVRVRQNRGYGNGLIAGISSSRTRFVGWIHADQLNLLSEIASWDLESLKDDEFIKGYRKNRPASQKVVSVGMELICSLILGQRLREINAQPSLYPREFLIAWENQPLDFSLDMFIYSKAKLVGLKENRKDVLFVDRKIGMSNWKFGIRSILMMSLKTVKASWSFRRLSK